MRSKRDHEFKRGCVILAVATILTALALPNTKFATFGEVESQHEDFIAETETEAETRQIRREKVIVEYTESEQSAEVTETATETEPEIQTEATTKAPAATHPIYSVDGDILDLDLQRFAWEELKSKGIEWWMPYLMLTAYQESSFNIYDITDGLDYGLLQYRITFWDERAERYGYAGADIFNPYVQIYIYVRQTAARINAGLSVSETISRHKTSDHVTAIDWEYVEQVMGHEITQVH